MLKHPFSALVTGPSQSGKTQWVCRLLACIDKMLTLKPERIYYCYSEWQPTYSKIAALGNVQLIEGLPDLDELRDPNVPALVVMDDLMTELSKSTALTTLFTKAVHHWNISCIHIIQNLFYQNTRTARINASYIVLFKSPGDKLQVSTLARQLYPTNTRMFLDVYRDATSTPYGYLLIDLTQTTDENLRLRTSVFPDETVCIYTPRSL
jgi:hypothetical protein